MAGRARWGKLHARSSVPLLLAARPPPPLAQLLQAMSVLTLLLCSVALYLPQTATAQHPEATVSADELAALPHESQRVVAKLLQHVAAMQSDIAALIERDRERQRELNALQTAKLSADERVEQLRQRVAALEDGGSCCTTARGAGAGPSPRRRRSRLLEQAVPGG